MDPISKALERAQSERPSVRDWVRPTLEQEDAGGAVLARRELTEIALDSKLLRRNHIMSGRSGDDPVVSDRYRVLRTRVVQLMKPNGWRTLGVTSPGARAGKTLTSINLALSLARDSAHDVILVDADLRKSSLGRDLGVPVEHGMLDYLTQDDLALEEVLVSIADIPNLWLLPGQRSTGTDVPELLTSRRMVELLDRLREWSASTIVVVDLPPIFVGDDVIALAPHLDCFLLLVDETATKSDELAEAAQMLAGHNLLGTVLNRSGAKNKSFEDYYQMGDSAERVADEAPG
jgi:Mrp family chromosome partitioning ATPase